MMDRIRIALLSVMGLLVLCAVGLGVLLYTPPGRAAIADLIENEIAGELGGEAAIGAIRGRLPGHVIIEDLVLSDAGEIWAQIDRAELRWRPLHLLAGWIDITSVIVDGGAVFSEPPDKDNNEPFSIPLPEDLPSLRLEALEINNLQSHLGGVSARLDGAGGAFMDGTEINARLKLTSANDADTIDAIVDIAPDANRFFVDATIASQANGVVASIADLGGPLFVEIDGDSPPDRAEISVSGVIGAYGRIDAQLLANLTALVTIDADGAFAPGERLAGIDELSAPIKFQISLKDKDQGGHIKIDQLQSAIGLITGEFEWAGLRERKNHLAADLNIRLAETYRTDLQPYIGTDLIVGIAMQRRPDDYAFDAILRSEKIEAAVRQGATDLNKNVSGDLVATMTVAEPLPAGPARLESRFAVDLDDTASLRAFDLQHGDGFHAEGDADYSFTEETIRVDADIDAAPAFVSAVIPGVTPRGPVAATIDASGLVNLFTLNARIEAPEIALGENMAPAFNADISLAGLPKLPTGDIAAAATNGAGKFSATLRSSQNGRIAAPQIIYTGDGFALNGAGAFNPQTQRGELDLTYTGEETAEPWPGLNIAGAFNAAGVFARNGKGADITVTSQALRVNTLGMAGLSARAFGPSDAIDAKVAMGAINVDETNIKDVSVTALIDATSGAHIRLTEAGAAISDNVARLLQPGDIIVKDGVTFRNIRLGWGANGRIAFDGAVTDTRWNGTLDLADVNIPQTDGRATLNIVLDTDETEAARGEFLLTSLISNAVASISGKLLWDGEAVTLSSLPQEDALDMNLSLPAKLTRTPRLAVSTDGALAGYVRYDGAIEPFAAFMPPELQTLEGFLAADFSIAGTLENPSLDGAAEITEGAYTELRSGLSIAGLHSRADAQVSTQGSRIEFSGGARGGGQTGEDTITIGGAMTLADQSRLDLEIAFNDAALSAHPVDVVRADGNISFTGDLDAITATGALTVRELSAEIITPEVTGLVPIEVVNIDQAGAEDAISQTAKKSTLTYDVDITADDRIFIRGRGVDSEWSANINIASSNDAPIIIGAMRLRRGTLDFSGRRFDIETGRILFDRLSPNNPLLEIRATLETSDVTATIDVSGRANEPTIELNSTPDLPDEDIMALVLFGKPADELTAFESLQTAQALASLGGIGPFGGTGLTGSIRRATGLDLLNFDIDPENGGGSLTVGKYVADGLFVSATQDAQGKGGAVIIEYEITDNISVETEVRQDGDQTVSANWKKDF